VHAHRNQERHCPGRVACGLTWSRKNSVARSRGLGSPPRDWGESPWGEGTGGDFSISRSHRFASSSKKPFFRWASRIASHEPVDLPEDPGEAARVAERELSLKAEEYIEAYRAAKAQGREGW